MTTGHYRRPGWFTKNVFNRAVAGATQLGLSVAGSRILEVRGRRSGQPRTNPVNLLDYQGKTYLVAARGETEWVRNLRADDGRLTLILGRRRKRFLATELTGAEAVGVLKAYVKKWKWEVGQFFEGISPDASEDAWQAELQRHPVFEISPAGGADPPT